MYYIIINDQQQGPFAKEELLSRGLTPQTMVWCQGMPDWMPASSVHDLNDLFARPQQPQYQQPYQQQYPQQQYPQQPYQQPDQQPYQQPYQYPQQPVGTFTNWLPWAIVGTVLGICSCIGLVLGIIGITKANGANNAYKCGDYDLARSVNNSARTLTILSLVFDGIGILFNIAFLAD